MLAILKELMVSSVSLHVGIMNLLYVIIASIGVSSVSLHVGIMNYRRDQLHRIHYVSSVSLHVGIMNS